MEPTACDLFHRCLGRQHDDDWNEFTRRYEGRVRSMLYYNLVKNAYPRPDQDLDEFVQDFYLKLLVTRASSFQGHTEEELWTYLRRVIRSLVVDRWRATEKKARRTRPDAEEGADQQRSALTPEDHAIARQSLHFALLRCRRALGGAEMRMRVLLLAFLYGCDSQEIALAIGWSTAGQIDALLHRIRRRLAERGIELPHRRPQRRPGRL